MKGVGDMEKTLKIAISLPKVDFEKIERIRKELLLGRSAVIDKAIRFWLEHLEKKEAVKCYENGYRKKPEKVSELKALEQAQYEVLSGGWE